MLILTPMLSVFSSCPLDAAEVTVYIRFVLSVSESFTSDGDVIPEKNMFSGV
jgi:hypothetical protein